MKSTIGSLIYHLCKENWCVRCERLDGIEGNKILRNLARRIFDLRDMGMLVMPISDLGII